MHSPSPTVLLANEPRSYREALAMAIEASRPGLAVRVGDPDRIEDEIERWRPTLVVSSTAVDVAFRPDATWLMLYPDGARYAVTSQGGHEDVVRDFALDDLLSLVDGALAEPNAAPPVKSAADDPGIERVVLTV